MRLPSADAVEIDVRKVRDYLLAATHPVGRHKARFRRIASTEDAVWLKDTAFGRKYIVIGQLVGAAGTARIQTVWIQEPGHPFVRLVTVLPRSS